MTLLESLKENNDRKYISFWGLISHMLSVNDERDDENHVIDETYSSIAEILLRLKIHEKVRYFIYDYDNFSFEQIDEFEINKAKIFLKALLPSNRKKLTPTEVVSIQRDFKNYFWLKESVEHILPNGYLDFTNPKFSHESKHRLLSEEIPNYEKMIMNLQLKTEQSTDEEIIHLQQKNQLLQEKIDELEAKQGYLDRNNEHFSVEMKVCHDTWNHCYNNEKLSNLSNSKQVEKYLSTYPDFEVGNNAAKRIATVINPKKFLVDVK